ncbi:TPA: hypothetical protein H1902_004426 [Salmonella enterica]|uniref:Uncharacterized protein n=1 Tax=Salmonella enterica subsp. enterica serovar Strasbourg TaxID=682796 RepID=A0A5X7K4T8_SALET|nr:hypothetical protein [Salmonella enterica]EBR9811192.1 hypothetical protein [Salmonella enterica subsp. enterica serovar Teshie]ECA7542304.1 hypothetical protein [Salmonella enterica subsp. enterica serovar Strasbourg]ECF3546593.1 hypothetical protein [Salmonella enterica subsp. enterica]HBL9985019.1 hypothetical protein [Salmonella enterica subsp. enterica serovar Fomeco]
MSWQKLVLMNYTQTLQADAPAGLVQPFACSDASSEQTHGLRGVSTKSNTITRNTHYVISHAKFIAYHY